MYMQGKRITPEQGKVYQNKGGGEFLCIESFDGSAVMQNTASRWTFNCLLYTSPSPRDTR